jgi:hypothetical protein
MGHLEITLAGRAYVIPPFTLRQLQRIELVEARAVLQRRRTLDDNGALDHESVLANVETEMAKIAGVIAVALSKAYPEVADGLEDIEGLKAHELSSAYESILDHGGFRRVAELAAEPAAEAVAEPAKAPRKRKVA